MCKWSEKRLSPTLVGKTTKSEPRPPKGKTPPPDALAPGGGTTGELEEKRPTDRSLARPVVFSRPCSLVFKQASLSPATEMPVRSGQIG